ncbi:MAG: hypothetical protein JWN04_4339 [Myxococcaceae bacterium]|nr:hypothetical protein [Myxococcaceae bacterium]
MNIACAVLAAGGSTRMGQPKQLLRIDGQPLIRRIVQICCASRCDQAAVVLGAHADEVQEVIGDARVTVLQNDVWSEGMSSSLHVAVHWAQQVGADALLIAACDQPFLTVDHLDALCAAYVCEQRSIASAYNETLGVPALVEAKLFEQLLAIRGDRGAAIVLRRETDIGQIAWPDGALDLDTPQDLMVMLGR